jgi:hypothetical protein
VCSHISARGDERITQDDDAAAWFVTVFFQLVTVHSSYKGKQCRYNDAVKETP